MRDLVSQTKVLWVDTTAHATTGNHSLDVDRDGYDSLTIALITGGLSNTVATVHCHDSDDNSTWRSLDARPEVFVGGDRHNFGLAPALDNRAARLGYIGGRRYFRVELRVATQNSTPSGVMLVAILGHPKDYPQADQHI